MSAKTGLLVVSNPKQIGHILSCVQEHVKNTLYIQLLSALSDPFGHFHPRIFKTWPNFSKTIFNIYSRAAIHCHNLDVKVLLSGIKNEIPKIHTQKPIDIIIFDKSHSQTEIDDFIDNRIQNLTKEYSTVTLDSGKFDIVNDNNNGTVCKHTVLGGTFDRLHLAHKLMLSEAALRASKKVSIGVTDKNMLQTKLLWELIEDIGTRTKNVSDFLTDICPELEYNIVPLFDPFGPAIVDPSMELIVVSEETIKGGEKINEIRAERNLDTLKIVPIELVDEPDPRPIEEKKISSSTARIRLLGTVLRSIKPNLNIPRKPYIIGLTGGIASGKTGVASWLTELGALVIYCDIIAHELYIKGKPCHKSIIEHFGEIVLTDDGEINRKVLGEIVFKNPEKLQILNSLLWPAMAAEVNEIIRKSDKEVVVIEAAILLKAGWERYCHEVWSTLIPKDEAINRLITRNNLTKEQAEDRLNSQPPNTYYVENANVVFCTIWAPEYTREQVVKAWNLLQERILS